MDIPAPFDFAYNENAAMAMDRGIRGYTMSWGHLIASAQATMGFYQDLNPIPETLDSLYNQSAVLPLIAAARILDTASRQVDDIPQTDRLYLSVLAAVAYGMYANFPSAHAVVQARLATLLEQAPEIAPVVATAAPSLLPGILLTQPKSTLHKQYIESLNSLLYTDDDALPDRVRELLVQCILSAESSFEAALLESCALTLEHVIHLSIIRVFKREGLPIPPSYIQQLLRTGITTLLPPQYTAIATQHYVTDSHNALVALPTGTGKTLLAELVLVSSLQDRPGLACYIVPYLALGSQVANTIERHMPSHIRVHRLMGGYREPDSLDPESRQEIIVATPERVDSLLRTTTEIIPSIRSIIFDEAHNIVSGARGARQEGIITRLRLLQNQGHPLRIILLSAVLDTYDHLAKWLGVNTDAVVANTWRATARRTATWRDTGRLIWSIGDDPLRGKGVSSGLRMGHVDLAWPEFDFYFPRNPGEERKQAKRAYANIAYLVEHLRRWHAAPVLLVCATKRATRGVAEALGERFDVLEPVPPGVGDVIRTIRSAHPFLIPLASLLEKGVSYHNASLSHDVRLGIEEAARRGELRAIVSTTTLAEGVDLPFRFTIIVDWLTWRGGDSGLESGPMSSLLFRNIAGRSGRPYRFSEGDTVVYDNPLVDPRYARPDSRYALQDRLFLSGGAGELRSTLAGLGTGKPSDEIVAAVASQVMAAVPENPTVDDLAGAFSRHSLAWQGGDAEQGLILRLSHESTQSMLRDDLPLAQAASPLRLTSLGQAANHTGMSPDSCRQIVRFLQREVEDVDLSANELAAEVLRAMGDIPEQGNRDLRNVLKEGSRSRFCVKPSDFENVLQQWISGSAEEDIFVGLPYAIRSSRQPSAEAWLRGERGRSDWDSVYDDFVEFLTSGVRQFLPWAMRSTAILSEAVGGWGADIPWRDWADMLEEGVDSSWAVAARRLGAPASRREVTVVGRLWPTEFCSPGDPLGIRTMVELGVRDEVADIFQRSRIALGDQHDEQMRILERWVLDWR